MHDFILCAPEPVPPSAFGSLRATTAVARGRGTVWEQLVLPRLVRASGADVLFAPAYTGPLLSRVPMVLTIHDVSFAAHPEWFRRRERVRRNALTRKSARRAAAVLTVSEFSAREIETRLGIDRGRIHVIPNAAPLRPATMLAIGAREPLVVFVGSIFNRRHVPDLLAAFAIAARGRPSARLVIAGANRTWPREDIARLIARSEVAPRIAWLYHASNQEVTALLARASVLVFLSEYEGFALTPLEGLAHGVAPVMADTPVAREIYGDAAVFVAVGDVDGAAAAIGRLLDSPAERAALVGRAGPLWQRYDRDTCARATLAVLMKAAR